MSQEVATIGKYPFHMELVDASSDFGAHIAEIPYYFAENEVDYLKESSSFACNRHEITTKICHALTIFLAGAVVLVPEADVERGFKHARDNILELATNMMVSPEPPLQENKLLIQRIKERMGEYAKEGGGCSVILPEGFAITQLQENDILETNFVLRNKEFGSVAFSDNGDEGADGDLTRRNDAVRVIGPDVGWLGIETYTYKEEKPLKIQEQYHKILEALASSCTPIPPNPSQEIVAK